MAYQTQSCLLRALCRFHAAGAPTPLRPFLQLGGLVLVTSQSLLLVPKLRGCGELWAARGLFTSSCFHLDSVSLESFVVVVISPVDPVSCGSSLDLDKVPHRNTTVRSRPAARCLYLDSFASLICPPAISYFLE